MFQKILAKLFTRRGPIPADSSSLLEPPADNILLTAKDFEFLITPSDIDIPASDFDGLMTPDSLRWAKVMKGNWPYYQVDGDEYTYSWEPPGIQMTFSANMPYPKAKVIADEVVRKLVAYTDQPIELVLISTDVPLRFDNVVPPATAAFQIKAAFQVTGRPFFLLGDILSGRIKKGMIVDLNPIGIEKKLVLEAIEFALHREGVEVWEDVGLGISGLTDAEKELLKTESPFSILITID